MKRLALLFALTAPPALAHGLTATSTGSVRAELTVPLTATREADLDFGAIFATTTAGLVILAPDGTAGYTGGAHPACLPAACGKLHPASFMVSGEPGRGYLVTVPTSVTATGTTTGGISTPVLQVSDLVVRSASRPAAVAVGQLDRTGHDRFQVGGTLHIPPPFPPPTTAPPLPSWLHTVEHVCRNYGFSHN